MSYGQFLGVFLCVPLLVTLVVVRRRLDRMVWLLVGGLSVVALVYTGPWDNAIIANGVWSYSRHQILGVLIGRVPLEEYLFYVLQVALTGCFTVYVLSRRGE